jgi:tRNA 5-methylaminomethyl-2-thiouridine biosynthesis bifunctional protein
MLDWKDGQPYSRRYGDVYYSADSGIEETRHVFLAGNRLPERFAALQSGTSLCLGETGFGTGLNFLCAWALFDELAPRSAALDFFSVENDPLADDELAEALAPWAALQGRAGALRERWYRRVPGWNRWSFAAGRVRLTLAIDDVADALPQLPAGAVDAWLLDGFAPAKNPEMWSDAVLGGVVRASRPGATVATYTSAGWVRRGLQQAGFAVERAPGFGRKREMLRGALAAASGAVSTPADGPASAAARHRPETAVVIGGGIAGCAAAHALARRGVSVTLVDRAPRLAAGASGNPRGILYARFGAGAHPLHRFVLAAYGHALALCDDVLPVDGVVRAECGLLQLACSDDEATRIGRLARRTWPPPLLEFVDAARASALAGVALAHGGLWFPGGGWVVPPQLCAKLAEDDRIALRLGHDAHTLERDGHGWRAAGRDADGRPWQVGADLAVVCCAHAATRFAPLARFALTPVRGQVTALPATAATQALRTIVCGDGYCMPAVDGVHIVGATHAIGDAGDDLRSGDHAANLARLAGYAPALSAHFGAVDAAALDGRAAVRCSLPGAVPLVGRVDDGLYASLAHGTRGLVTAGLAGEALACLAHGELPPLPTGVLAALMPVAPAGERRRGAATP